MATIYINGKPQHLNPAGDGRDFEEMVREHMGETAADYFRVNYTDTDHRGHYCEAGEPEGFIREKG